jgi:hypothetical protein
VVWVYRIAPGKDVEFKALYGSHGVWSELCGKSPEFLGERLARVTAMEMFCERVEIWRSRWSWSEFRESNRAERKRIAGFAEAEGIVLSERIVEMYYESRSGPDDDSSLTPA